MATSNPPDLKPVKLVARDSDDLAVVSALLQDAALTTDDLGYDAGVRRFALTANRFVWEKKRLFRQPRGWRRRCALHFDHVTAVQRKGFDDLDAGFASGGAPALALLSLLLDTSDTATHIHLVFAGGAEIRLTVDSIDVYLSDVSDSWEAIRRPQH